jgi:hypothetical protein
MLNEIILSKACVVAVTNLARPVFQLTVPLILMPNPIGFSLERLGFSAIREGTSKWLNILVHVFCPIRRLIELFDFEA